MQSIRSRHPAVPVVLMTERGCEDAAKAALRQGATSFVPRRLLKSDLVETAYNVLTVAQIRRQEAEVLDCLLSSEHVFVLDNDPAQLHTLLGMFREQLTRRLVRDETVLMQVMMALDEALANALHHGNLEVDSHLRETSIDTYNALIEERLSTPPYRERKVYVTVRINRQEACYVIRDEGPGFDASRLPDPTDSDNLDRVSGRGLFLIRTFMDEVHHNHTGNEITLVKRSACR